MADKAQIKTVYEAIKAHDNAKLRQLFASQPDEASRSELANATYANSWLRDSVGMTRQDFQSTAPSGTWHEPLCYMAIHSENEEAFKLLLENGLQHPDCVWVAAQQDSGCYSNGKGQTPASASILETALEKCHNQELEFPVYLAVTERGLALFEKLIRHAQANEGQIDYTTALINMLDRENKLPADEYNQIIDQIIPKANLQDPRIIQEGLQMRTPILQKLLDHGMAVTAEYLPLVLKRKNPKLLALLIDNGTVTAQDALDGLLKHRSEPPALNRVTLCLEKGAQVTREHIAAAAHYKKGAEYTPDQYATFGYLMDQYEAQLQKPKNPTPETVVIGMSNLAAAAKTAKRA